VTRKGQLTASWLLLATAVASADLAGQEEEPPDSLEAADGDTRQALEDQRSGAYRLESIDGEEPPLLFRPVGGDTLAVEEHSLLHLSSSGTFRLDLHLRSIYAAGHAGRFGRFTHRGTWEGEGDEVILTYRDATVERGLHRSGHCVVIRSHGADWLFKKIGEGRETPPECPEPEG